MNQKDTYKNSIILPFCFNYFFQPGVYAIFNKKRLTTNLVRVIVVKGNYYLSFSLAAAK